VLDRTVAASDLGKIFVHLKQRVVVLDRAIVVRADITSQPDQEKLFSFTVGNDIEATSKKSALELCWEMCERVQWLNRRIALHQYPEERIERSGKLYYFLIRVAGIAGGDVAASKFMSDSRNDRRVRDYLAEHECPAYLVESFGDVPADGNATLQRNGRYQYIIRQATNDKPWSSFSRCLECGEEFVDGKGEQKFSEFAFCGETRLQQGKCKPKWLSKHPVQCDLSRPEPGFHQVTRKDVAWGERQGLDHPRSSARNRTVYDAKLLADVATYRAKDRTLQNDALPFKKSADLYRKFCNAFEFKKKTAAQLREAVAEELVNTIPYDDLKTLIGSAENRNLLTASLPKAFEGFYSGEHTRKGKRHYVRHGAEDVSFVRQQDMNLAIEF